ncbi:alpha/beta hydrolase family protein [Brevundimonas sp.]|uniref:alpha/beta hydrolase family protein n=1 Tax=Brevundimonas sp. TaxID=1871086 RepID=UPI002FD8C6FC
MRVGVVWGVAAAILSGGAQEAPGAAEPSASATPPTAERPNGDYYADALVCPDDVPVNARRGRMTIPSNNRTIDAMVYAPRGTPNGAVIVMMHGPRGLRATLPVFDPRALQLASRGYFVVMPQYYDATSNEVERERRNLDRWRDVADDVATRMAEVPGVDATRVGVWGVSLGGWLAAESVMKNASLRSAVAVSAGAAMAPARTFRRQVPILMVNAEGDPVISAESASEFATDLRGRGAEIDARSLTGAVHFLAQPQWCETFAASREFFDRTLLAP